MRMGLRPRDPQQRRSLCNPKLKGMGSKRPALGGVQRQSLIGARIEAHRCGLSSWPALCRPSTSPLRATNKDVDGRASSLSELTRRGIGR
jgi:hypothetical protein